MKSLRMAKRHLPKFLESLGKWGKVYVPVKLGKNSYRWEEFDGEVDNIALDALRTVIPAKKFFYKPREVMFEYDKTNGYTQACAECEEDVILFGIHSCGIHSLETLDNIFAGKYVDNYYFTRRKNITIVGTSCMPDRHCFCKSMGADTVDEGYDIFLTDLGDDFLIGVGSSKGDDIVNDNPEIYEEVDESTTKRYLEFRNKRDESFELVLDTSDLPTILDFQYDNPLWDELGERCLACGSCSMVCPTCYCYNVDDTINLDSETGERWREWDCCLFRDHALVAGGHNFRENQGGRLKHRYLHKQQAYLGDFGRTACVGCGRCIVACPANIDYVECLKAMRGEMTNA